jgi:hypothetical protein
MATDRELAEQAERHLKATTVSYPEWLRRVAAGRYTPKDGSMTEWGKALTTLEHLNHLHPAPPLSGAGRLTRPTRPRRSAP